MPVAVWTCHPFPVLAAAGPLAENRPGPGSMHDLATKSDGDLARTVMSAEAGPRRAEEAELCRRLAPRVRLYGLRHLRDEDAAGELVQRVLLLTLEKLRAGAVREPERIASFVLGAARLTAQTLRRATRREEPLDESRERPDVPPGAGTEPFARERLAGCLGELAERERTVVVLTYFQEQSTSEIASALGLKDGNVRVIRHRAIGRLRHCLGLQAGAVA
jgi:RNA polymerase sigma-70 factor (ECF subfamily)